MKYILEGLKSCSPCCSRERGIHLWLDLGGWPRAGYPWDNSPGDVPGGAPRRFQLTKASGHFSDVAPSPLQKRQGILLLAWPSLD